MAECIGHLQDKAYLIKTLLAEGAPVKPQKVIVSEQILFVFLLFYYVIIIITYHIIYIL